MDCLDFLRQLGDGESTGEGLAAEHRRSCASCREAAEQWEALAQELEAISDAPPSIVFTAPLVRPVARGERAGSSLSLAVALTLALLVSAFATSALLGKLPGAQSRTDPGREAWTPAGTPVPVETHEAEPEAKEPATPAPQGRIVAAPHRREKVAPTLCTVVAADGGVRVVSVDGSVPVVDGARVTVPEAGGVGLALTLRDAGFAPGTYEVSCR